MQRIKERRKGRGGDKPAKVCRFLAKTGGCRFGDKCRFSHGTDGDDLGGGGKVDKGGEEEDVMDLVEVRLSRPGCFMFTG